RTELRLRRSPLRRHRPAPLRVLRPGGVPRRDFDTAGRTLMPRGVLLCAIALVAGCGTGGAGDSPESRAPPVFEPVQAGNQDAFVALQRQVADVQAACPNLDATSQGEVTAELAAARDQALRALTTCREAVNFTGAVFVRADRSPSNIITYRWPSCTPSLT